uniref:Uncharacterized LOC100180951 n=1 Tax=Ciona intestinalis TaxID=7719 RepID=F6QUM3_CIOIN|nr:uncharacterized protein LOC100180951 [Ciona intestinalis]XP_026691514.1 uncharacterized protein LOC100180951 [Ciona intestinalis]|eukprot:XP_002123651.1 uncharacterized protein LOC100180951 [Ciona intestinalis]
MRFTVLVFVTFLFSAWVCMAAEVQAPPEEKPGLPPRITEKDAERIKEIHKQIPGLHPDTFKIIPTSFRTKRTPEQIESDKKAKERFLAKDVSKLHEHVKYYIDNHKELYGNMTFEEAELFTKKIEDEMKLEETKHDEM